MEHSKHHRHHKHRREVIFMTTEQEAQLTDLESKNTAGTITPEEENVRIALLELDEREENKAEADKALADAIAANPSPVPDPVTVAHDEVVKAQEAVDVAQKAYDDAEAVIAPTP